MGCLPVVSAQSQTLFHLILGENDYPHFIDKGIDPMSKIHTVGYIYRTNGPVSLIHKL